MKERIRNVLMQDLTLEFAKKVSQCVMEFVAVCLLCILSPISAWAADDLVNAALAGDKEKLVALIANGAEVKGYKGGIALYFAALKGKYEAAEVLVAHGADVNARDRYSGFTPLHQTVSYVSDKSPPARGEMPPMDVAVAHNKQKLAELLILHGAEVNAKDNGGRTPLYLAATKEMAELLLKHGATINAETNGNGGSPLYYVASGNKEVAGVLIAHGADVNYKNQSGNTPLFTAVFNNQKAIVQLLINKGADVNAKTRDGQTIMEAAILYADHNAASNAAAINTQKEIVQLLIDSGADINAKNRDGRTLVVAAIDNNKIELATLLLAHGAKADVVTDSYAGRTGLYRAVSTGNASLVELMLKNGARINDTDKEGQTPLFVAVGNNQKDIAEWLIKHGASVNVVTKKGTPLLHRTRNKEILELLLKHGADANAKDANGDSLLWDVCYDSKLTELLLKHGADINIKNSQGRTALHLATRFARNNVAKWLLAHGADINAKDDYYGQTPLFHAIRSFERHFDSVPSPIRVLQPVASPVSTSNSRQAKSERGSPPISSAADLSNVFPSGFDTSNSIATVKILLANGANVTMIDREGQSPLHVAPTKDSAELLLARGAAVNAKRTDGATPLHLAAVYGRKDVVQALLAHGADVNARTKNGITPLHYAKGPEVVKLLLASGADANAADSGGNTALYMADEPAVVELLLSRGAILNAKNAHGQTPLLSTIRTFISNLPAHGLIDGPLGEPLVVAHGGSKEVIKALLDRGADVNLDDLEGYMPLFYVREAIKAYSEVADQLHEVEKLLLTHGAKLEKRKKESAPQLQQNFPPELAGISPISLGTRVMMQLAIQYEERRKAGKENPLYFREPEAVSIATNKPTFDDHLQLLNYFQNLPADTQKRGLWIKRMARNLWIQKDAERLDTLTQQAQLRKISLFVCEPKENKTRSSWLVTWECEQVSPKRGVKTLSCEAMESKGQPARWECKNK